METKLEAHGVKTVGGESADKIRELVIQLRALLNETYPELQLPPDSDNILERCVRHRKLDIYDAANQVHTFFKLFYDLNKIKGENIFLPSMHKAYFIDSMAMGLLKQKNPNGMPIYYANYAAMPGEMFCTAKGMAVCIMMMNELFRPYPNKGSTGVVVLVNLKGFGFSHAKQFTPSRLRVFAKIIQGAIPVSFKAFHCINTPSVFLGVYALLKPLLRQKMKDRVHLYGTDLTEFYKVIDKSVLPVALEGDLPDEEAVDTNFTKALCDKDEYYRDYVQYGYASKLDKKS